MTQEFDRALSTVSKEEIRASGIRVGYRAVSALAVSGFVFSLFTPLMFLSNWFAICPLIGVLCGLFGLYNILSSPFDYTGKYFAHGAVALSLLFGLSAGGWGLWNFYFSVPFGYTTVDFADLLPNPDTKKLPSYIVELGQDHRKIYIRGYMYPGRQLSGIQDFMLVRTVEHCKFCTPEQNPFDMISVHCTGDMRVPFRRRPVFVGGTLYINENFRYGELPYHIEADLFR
ncbi:MAG: hypothetical protein ACRCUY_07310 [Thermoguttaceae bacterium]